MLKQSLQQKLLQKLSPQQIQVIKLLELPAIQLEERIKKELEENPVLELNENVEKEEKEKEQQRSDTKDEQESDRNENQDEFSLEDYLGDDDTPAYKLQAKNYSKDDKREDIPFAAGKTFHDSLLTQLDLQRVSEEQKKLAKYLIGSIDEDGYLRRKLEAIVDDLSFSEGIDTTEQDLEDILKIIQDFDPPGVGARNLRECLLLQIAEKDLNDPDYALAHKVLKNHFVQFTRKHYKKIIQKCNIKEEELKSAIDRILKLNPKPGSAHDSFSNKTSPHIIPDFILEQLDEELVLGLNTKNVPDLRLNQSYIDMIKEFSAKKRNKDQKEALVFVKQKLDSAKWFIDAIRQRQQTLMSTMHAIINYQKKYFLDGDESLLKPMILKDIADITSLDISTISRVSNSKYIQTSFGIFPLKYFFSEGMITQTGEEVSTREIKKTLQECVDNEDKRKPLTDEKLVKILQDKQYKIARRTVAKYREQLNIPVARLRRQL